MGLGAGGRDHRSGREPVAWGWSATHADDRGRRGAAPLPWREHAVDRAAGQRRLERHGRVAPDPAVLIGKVRPGPEAASWDVVVDRAARSGPSMVARRPAPAPPTAASLGPSSTSVVSIGGIPSAAMPSATNIHHTGRFAHLPCDDLLRGEPHRAHLLSS